MVRHFINDRADWLKECYSTPSKTVWKSTYHVVIIQEGDQTYATFETWRCCSILEIVQFPDQCQTMGVGSKHNSLDTPEIICLILVKLPLYLQDRWNRNTLLLMRRDSREPTLIDFANLFEDEMTLVNDPLYSKKTASQYLEIGPTRQGQGGDRRKFHTMATNTDNSSEVIQRGNKMSNERTCPLCREKHDIKDCNYYLQQTLEGRRKLIFRKKLCYGCFQEIKKDHNAR